jgi:methionyl-tRNA formyltransferase
MDHGPIVTQEAISFSKENIGYTEAEKELGIEGGRILAKILPEYVAGNIKEIPQDHSQATFTKKIKKEDALIDLSANALDNLRKIKAFQEWPGAYFFYDSNKGKIRIKINDAHIENNDLVLDKIIPEGKKEMLWDDFKKGN